MVKQRNVPFVRFCFIAETKSISLFFFLTLNNSRDFLSLLHIYGISCANTHRYTRMIFFLASAKFHSNASVSIRSFIMCLMTNYTPFASVSFSFTLHFSKPSCSLTLLLSWPLFRSFALSFSCFFDSHPKL